MDMVDRPEEAVSLLSRACYDVVISEMARAYNPQAGRQFAREVNNLPRGPDLISYILRLDRSLGTPGFSHGITNTPAELVHMVLDVMERRLPYRCSGS